jgi:hypothetical protein
MNDFKSYFSALSKYEQKPAAHLISAWDPADSNDIEGAFRPAFNRRQLKFEVQSGISDSSLAYKVADAFVEGINPVLRRYSLMPCPGRGYPDKLLLRLKDKRLFAFEIKGKTFFDPHDGNRMALMSKSEKLRRSFPKNKPICHVLAIVFYEKRRMGRRCQISIVGLRLDFLPPSTRVETRLEASVSPRSLAKGSHVHSILIPTWVREDKTKHDITML